jgi:hypothetical protein
MNTSVSSLVEQDVTKNVMTSEPLVGVGGSQLTTALAEHETGANITVTFTGDPIGTPNDRDEEILTGSYTAEE